MYIAPGNPLDVGGIKRISKSCKTLLGGQKCTLQGDDVDMINTDFQKGKGLITTERLAHIRFLWLKSALYSSKEI